MDDRPAPSSREFNTDSYVLGGLLYRQILALRGYRRHRGAGLLSTSATGPALAPSTSTPAER